MVEDGEFHWQPCAICHRFNKTHMMSNNLHDIQIWIVHSSPVITGSNFSKIYTTDAMLYMPHISPEKARHNVSVMSTKIYVLPWHCCATFKIIFCWAVIWRNVLVSYRLFHMIMKFTKSTLTINFLRHRCGGAWCIISRKVLFNILAESSKNVH